MHGWVFRLALTGLGLLAADAILPGVRFDGPVALWLAALVLGLANAFVRPILILLTLPLTLLSLGWFLVVVNGLVVLLVAWLLPGFHLAGLGSAILASLIVGLVSWIANAFIGERARIEIWTARR